METDGGRKEKREGIEGRLYEVREGCKLTVRWREDRKKVNETAKGAREEVGNEKMGREISNEERR